MIDTLQFYFNIIVSHRTYDVGNKNVIIVLLQATVIFIYNC